jgi:hypothetical protein
MILVEDEKLQGMIKIFYDSMFQIIPRDEVIHIQCLCQVV